MKRRQFGFMAATSGAALTAGLGLPKTALGQVTADKAASLKTTLMPFGGERAGNADGSIPAWTGGATEVPAGWITGQPMPDLFADEQPTVTITAANMEQYKDRLTEGVMTLMQKYGYSIDVYPTHRTAAAPQFVYDNIALNAVNAQLAPGGGRLGFTGGYGGAPFPIPSDDPDVAGAQIIWNHLVRWVGSHYMASNLANYSMSGGLLTLVDQYKAAATYLYYNPSGSAATFKGFYALTYVLGLGPPSNQGSQFLIYAPTNPYVLNTEGWQYLSGQGRVRKVPEVQYDIPEAQVNGLINYDEVFVFDGSTDRFDWKLLSKKEMYVPYNCNKTFVLTDKDYGPNFVNPEKIRWELHRVWEVEATLHPGDRNVAPHRRFYMDEDTWLACLSDEWDAQGNFWKVGMNFPVVRPDLPGLIEFSFITHNVQQNGYVLQNIFANDAPVAQRTLDFVAVPSDSLFNPQSMAAQSQY